MDNAQYEAYRINAKLAGVAADVHECRITRITAKLRIEELWADVLLAERRRLFPYQVARAFETRIAVMAREVLT